MSTIAAALIGVVIGLASHDLAAQALTDQPFRPLQGTCPRCGARRGWTRSTCPECDRQIRREYLLAVVVSGAAVGVFSTLGLAWSLIPYGGFLLLTAALVVTDIDAMRIVDRLNLKGSAIVIGLLGVAAAVDGTLPAFLRGLFGGSIYFGGSFLLFALVRGRGFGAGDVKLSAVLGVFSAYLGWVALGRAAFFTAAIGGVVAIVALVFFKASRETELPYGPSMIFGAWLAIIVAGIGSGVIPA